MKKEDRHLFLSGFQLIIFDVGGTLTNDEAAVEGIRHECVDALMQTGDVSDLQVAVIADAREVGQRLLYQALQRPPLDYQNLPDRQIAYQRINHVCRELSVYLSSVPDRDIKREFTFGYSAADGTMQNEHDWTKTLVDAYRFQSDFMKPHPGMVKYLIDKCGLHSENVLYVGDSEIDAKMARAAGCCFMLAETFFDTSVTAEQDESNE